VEKSLKWILAVALILGVFDSAIAEGITHDSHSVESIRTALRSPISAQVLQQAKLFDDQVIQTQTAQGQSVHIINDSRYSRSTQIVCSLLQAIHGDPSKWVVRVLDTDPKTENAFVAGGPYIYI
jgi:hypothetical protein